MTCCNQLEFFDYRSRCTYLHTNVCRFPREKHLNSLSIHVIYLIFDHLIRKNTRKFYCNSFKIFMSYDIVSRGLNKKSQTVKKQVRWNH